MLKKFVLKRLCAFFVPYPGKEGVFAEKGARFRGKWGLGAPCPPPPNSPYTPLALPPPALLEDPPPGIVSKTPTAPGRGRGVGGGGGRRGAEAPFTAQTSPFFGENALRATSTCFGGFKWGCRCGGRMAGTHLRYTSNTNQKHPQYCWEFHDQLWEALSGTISEKRGVPSRTGGERILEMLWKPQMP